MKRAAIISAVLDGSREHQREFNEIVSDYNEIVRGRMGIPFADGAVALIALTVVAETEMIGEFMDKLGAVKGASVAVSYTKEGLDL